MLCPENPSPKTGQENAHRDSSPGQAIHLGEIWEQLRSGRMRITSSLCSGQRCYLTLATADPERSEMVNFALEHLTLLERVLLGEQQKAIAIELGLSPSTVALTLRRCLRALGVDCRFQRVPLLLVMTAQASRHRDRRVQGKLTPSQVGRTWLLSANRPDSTLSGVLGEEEAAVTRMWLEGKSYREIAELRGRSAHTVSNQLATTYGKLGVSGRVELVGSLMARWPQVVDAAP